MYSWTDRIDWHLNFENPWTLQFSTAIYKWTWKRNSNHSKLSCIVLFASTGTELDSTQWKLEKVCDIYKISFKPRNFAYWNYTNLLTISSSVSLAWGLNLGHRSMENKVAELLKMEVSDEITAANIHAIMSPRRPGYKRNVRNLLAGKLYILSDRFERHSFSIFGRINHSFRYNIFI